MCKIERDARHVTDNPGIVPWCHLECLAGSNFLSGAGSILNDHLPRNDISNVIFRWFSGLRSCVQRPSPPRSIGP